MILPERWIRPVPDLFFPSYWQKVLMYRKLTGYLVRRPELFQAALTHKSVIDDTQSRITESYDRLEFLGDAVLDMTVADVLYRTFPDKDEGFLSKKRDQVVNGRVLAVVAREIGLIQWLSATPGIKRQLNSDNQKLLADTYEAIVGAIYLDHSYRMARSFILKTVFSHVDIDHLRHLDTNFKSQLLEKVQATGNGELNYICISEDGPPHRREYTMQVKIGGDCYGSGRGRTKKEAEQIAARETLQQLSSRSAD